MSTEMEDAEVDNKEAPMEVLLKFTPSIALNISEAYWVTIHGRWRGIILLQR